jgi:chemotaxis protein methyltransferase WspC
VRAFADVVPDADLPPAAPTRADPLAEAMRLADEGHLVEAARLSESYLREHGPDAQAFYLLGIVRDAAGSKLQADEYLRKAIYLDPNHHDALIHLALLAGHRGDQAGARLFLERAERIKRRAADDSQQVRR